MSQSDKVYQMSQCQGIPAKGATNTPGVGSGITEIQKLVRLLWDVVQSTSRKRRAYAKLEQCGKHRDPAAPGD